MNFIPESANGGPVRLRLDELQVRTVCGPPLELKSLTDDERVLVRSVRATLRQLLKHNAAVRAGTIDGPYMHLQIVSED